LILYPAIDIRDGKAVRLTQGDYGRETAYDDDPVDAARRWEADGALWLHVVDLDGARAGEPVNLDQVQRIVAAVEIPIQLGGGLRDSLQVEQAISVGAERVVLGTTAVRDHALVEAIAAAHGDRVVAAVDAKGGRVAAEGWTEPSDLGPAELATQLWGRGVERFLYTPVEVDGTMEGPAVGALPELTAATGGELLYSGGVGSLDDLRALAALELDNLGGVIVGRALYEGRFTIAEAQAVLSAEDWTDC
jgi:phosphoribosylformimino-5-aminoimidazole carboxamide ribotide isomerase